MFSENRNAPSVANPAAWLNRSVIARMSVETVWSWAAPS